MAEERKLYKYCDINTAIKIIKSGAVLLNSPEKFNDPFDSKLYIDEENRTKTYELYINYLWIKSIENLVNRSDVNLSYLQKKTVSEVKILIENSKEISKIDGNYNPITSFEQLKFFPKHYKSEIENVVDGGREKFDKEFMANIYNVRNDARITCFSKRNDSILMWSHYADQHRGVCFEFLESRDYFKDVEYTNKKPIFNLYEASQQVLLSMFLDQKNVSINKELEDKLLKPFYVKSLDWSYEQEVRCVFSKDSLSTEEFIKDDKLDLIKMNINKIYIGAKCRDEEILNKVLMLAKNRNIPVEFMKEDEKEFKIVPDNGKTNTLPHS